jgi:hypothetical protein
VLVASLSLVCVGSASASGLRDVGRADAVTADGGRYAVVLRPGHRAPVVLDDSSSASRRLPGAPAGCSGPRLHERWVIVGCRTGLSNGYGDWWEPRVWDVRDGAPVELTGVETLQQRYWQRSFGAADPTWGPLGANWVAVRWHEYHSEFDGTLNWHTGEVLSDVLDGPRAVPDLDSVVFPQRELCTSLTRTVDPSYGESYPDPDPAFLPMAYAPPWAVQTNDLDQLVLLHCGQRRPVRVLARSWLTSAFAGRTVAWISHRRLHALYLNGGGERSWSLPPGRGADLAVTRAHVYVLRGTRLWRGNVPLPLPREPKPAHPRRVTRGQACPPRNRDELVSTGPGLRKQLVPSGSTSVTLCRYTPVYGRRAPLAGRLLRSRQFGGATVSGLTRRFNRLRPPRQGASSCPSDDGSTLLALFGYPHRRPVAVTVALHGCPTARNGVVFADVTAPLIVRLERLVS